MKTRICKACKCSKLVSDFQKNGTSKTGTQNYSTRCKACLSESWRDIAAENRRHSMIAKAAVDEKLNAITANNSAEFNEKYITYKKSRSKYIVQMDGKYHGHFYTIEGARAKKAELLENREANRRKQRIEKLEKQLLSIKNELEELKREEPN